MRCYSQLRESGIEEAAVYDPCCGGAYMLAVLGFLYGGFIKAIYASDVSEDAVKLAGANLSLLSETGLLKRREKLQELYLTYGKQSHAAAVKSVDRLFDKLQNNISVKTFQTDILSHDPLSGFDLKADLVITDVPYGALTSWDDAGGCAISRMMDAVKPILNKNAVVAVCRDKTQKSGNKNYIRIDKFQCGKRVIEIFGSK